MSSPPVVRPARAPAVAFGVFDVIVAALVAFGVFVGLPARYWVVDVGAVAIILVQLAGGVGLLGRFPWGTMAARWASRTTLVLGLCLVAALAVSASFLWGIYGAAGRGGSIIFILVIALVLPYLVLLPAAQLYWLSLRVPADEPPRRTGVVPSAAVTITAVPVSVVPTQNET